MTQTATRRHHFDTGDHVRIVDAEPGAPDPKGVVYYDFYRDLTGTVIKDYPDDTIAVSVDRASLPEHILRRHEQQENAQRDRWLNGLSDEDRNRLTEKERRFSLRYTLLVSAKHVVPEKPSAHSAKPKAAKSTPAVSAADSEVVSRATSADHDAAEEAYLKSKQGS